MSNDLCQFVGLISNQLILWTCTTHRMSFCIDFVTHGFCFMWSNAKIQRKYRTTCILMVCSGYSCCNLYGCRCWSWIPDHVEYQIALNLERYSSNQTVILALVESYCFSVQMLTCRFVVTVSLLHVTNLYSSFDFQCLAVAVSIILPLCKFFMVSIHCTIVLHILHHCTHYFKVEMNALFFPGRH